MLFGCSLVGILESPLLGPLDGGIRLGGPEVSDLLIQGIIEVWSRHEGLDGKKHSSDLEGWRPLVLEDIEADSSKLVDVGVVDLGSEEDLRWDHWVLVWEEELAIEDTSFVWSVGWAGNLDVEVSVVLLVWFSVDAHNYIQKLVSTISKTINHFSFISFCAAFLLVRLVRPQ